MFHTLDGATFQKVDEDRKPTSVQLSTAKVTKFYGARARTNTGCLNCRRRRKKCDEDHPRCGVCISRDEICEWPMPKVKNEPLKRISKISHVSKPETETETETQNIQPLEETGADTSWPVSPPNFRALSAVKGSETPTNSSEKMKIDSFDNAPEDFRANEVVQELEGFKEDLTNFQNELEQLKSSVPGVGKADVYHQDEPNGEIYIPTEFLAGFGFPYVYNLDEEGMMFLECYREQYCTFVSIGLDTLNYFLKTFLSIAASNEGITYALTAWGGFFIELRKPKSDFTKPWEYMRKATRCMCMQMGEYLKPHDKSQFFVLFAFYLIFIGIEVCTGDIRNWRGFMIQCSLLIQSYGGVLCVTDLFGYSNDIRWLISDFKFHDILSSKCLIDGPIFPVDEYELALAPRSEYGIDPLHGIVGPIYDIMSAIGTVKANLAQKWADLSYQISIEGPRANALTAEYYENAQNTIEDLKSRLANCKPQSVHMELLKDNAQDLALHVSLFELYTHICRIQLGTSLEKFPPNSVTQQFLLHEALKILDSLQATKIKVALSLLLLVCGMTCCAAHDRAGMTRRFRVHLKQYELGNLQRIEETVVEAWAVNPTGAICIDWADFVKDKNWHLYVG